MVIVMCIAALVVIVVLGVYRIHAAQQDGSVNEEGGGKRGWTDWDDSALTITVNPMEVRRGLVKNVPFVFPVQFLQHIDRRTYRLLVANASSLSHMSQALTFTIFTTYDSHNLKKITSVKQKLNFIKMYKLKYNVMQ